MSEYPSTTPKRKSRFSNGPPVIAKPNSDEDSANERKGFGYAITKKIKPDLATTLPKTQLTFEEQMKEAAARAKKIADNLTCSKPVTSMASSSIQTMTPEQQKQYLEQKEVIKKLYFYIIIYQCARS